MDRLCDLIKVYPNALDLDMCQFLIDFYDLNTNLHERLENDRKPNFTQINLTENYKLSEELTLVHETLVNETIRYRNLYYEFIDSRCFPEEHAFEQYRIKKYENTGNDAFDTHVDVKSLDTSRRYLSFLWYLNDVEVGGETMFKDLTLHPKRGTLVMFPPMWMYPHNGQPPVSGSKYIMSTYLHYI
jgi:hypothetical protein